MSTLVLERPDPLGVDPVGAIVAIVAIVELLRNYCVKYCINYCASFCVTCCSISLNISNSRGALRPPAEGGGLLLMLRDMLQQSTQ